jgi:putative membrane-bound dehydrogenase-like protein
MYVVEMRDYPNGPPAGQPPLSRVTLLEDTDGNGRFETSHVFADGLLFPTGVLPWDGGAIVTLAGEVRFLKDTDGDHKADVNEVWFSGFSEGNPQLRANHPTFGPDGWIYIANGLRGGKVKAAKEGWPQKEIEFRDHDFRFNPRTGEAEAIAGSGQFGLTFDAWGNRFLCSNRNPCYHVVLEDRDLARNSHLAVGSPVQDVAAAGDDSKVYPLVDAWTTSTLHSGQFTAACGLTIFAGDALPSECVGNAFVCEPTGSLVHREVLEPVGGTFRGTAAEKEAEFLASRDPWFRPVNLTTGPDGALYVVDMYRAVIEHPDWVPDELKNRKDERWGDDRGRIYRVAAKGKPPGQLPTLEKLSDDAEFFPGSNADSTVFISLLDHRNGWWRDTAARILSAAGHRWAGRSGLGFDSEKQAAARVRRVQVRRALSEPDANSDLFEVARLIQDADPQAAAAGVRLAEPYLKETISEKLAQELIWNPLLTKKDSPDPRVRFELARTLGDVPPEHGDPRILDALATIAARDAADRWTRAAVLSSTRDPLALYDAVVAKNADGAVPFLVDLAELIGRRREEKEVAGLVSRLATTGPEGGWALPILIGLGSGMGGSLEPALNVAADPDRRRLAAAVAWAAAVAGDETADPAGRVEAVRLLALAERSYALPSLVALAAVVDPQVRLAVVEALGRFRGDDRIAPALLTGFSEQSPAIRGAVLDALLADPARAAQVLDAVAAGDLPPSELGPTRIASLTKHPDPSVREKAASVFAPPADRQKVLAEYASALSLKADPARGREVFVKNCATCHRIGGLGIQVGPDIADSRVHTPEALLTDILDPNRAIDGRYLAYTAATIEGVVHTGLIAGETSNAVTLAQPEGKMVTLLREEIDSLRSDGTSLMPVGVERTIPPQEMADLISFIKNWRYLDGAVPLDDSGK